jgi:hypothetical protein
MTEKKPFVLYDRMTFEVSDSVCGIFRLRYTPLKMTRWSKDTPLKMTRETRDTPLRMTSGRLFTFTILQKYA